MTFKAFTSYISLSEHETEHADMPNGNIAESVIDGEEMNVAVTRRTKRKR